MAREDDPRRALKHSADTSRRAFFRTLGLSALGVAAGAGCGAERPARAPGRAVRVPITTEPTTLDRARAGDRHGQVIARLLSDPLVKLDANANLLPGVARTWRIDDGGTRITFELGDARWHDGRPVTAQDVVFTWRTYSDTSASIPELAQRFAIVDSVEATGERSAVVRYREPFAGALLSWNEPLLPAHHQERALAPLGCGPWRFVRWDRGERIVLAANEAHETPPLLAGIELEVIPGYAETIAALDAGSVDVAPLFPEEWAKRRDDAAFLDRFAIHGYRIPYIFYIAWRTTGGPDFLGDARVRRAFAHAIDRRGYLDGVAHGLGTVGITSFHPDMWGYDAALAAHEFDPRAARALLDEAGWRVKGDGETRVKDGVPLRFKLTYPATSAQTERLAAFCQANLASVGAAMELEPLEWSVFLQRTAERKYDAIMQGRYLPLDPDPFEIWHSSQASAGANYCQWSDPATDDLIEQGRTSFDRDFRTGIYERLQRRLHDEQPMTVLFYPESRVAVSKRLLGFRASMHGYLDFEPGPTAWSWDQDAAALRRALRSWCA